MDIPVGDVLRSLVKPDSFLGRLLARLCGVKIQAGDKTILLNEGASPLRGSKFDSKPHRIEPPRVGGPLRLAAFALLAPPLVMLACNEGSTTVSQPTTVVASPSPTPPPPVTVAPPAETPTTEPKGRGLELTCHNNSTLRIKNTNTIAVALTTYWTPLDAPLLFRDVIPETVQPGATLTRVYGKGCIQGDGDQPGVKEIGGCWYDKAGNSVRPEVATASCKPEPTPPPCVNRYVGTVLVYADQHVSGTYLYEVRTSNGTVVWSGSLARGASASFLYGPTGSRLYLWLRTSTSPVRWEQDSYVKAECSEPQAAWNERISYSCRQECVQQ